ncbi:DEAD/DEAH box helicase [Candidatus Pacearchaeota archaeon]|nr:DEAD/DEAH box helicase [Candidatus Pacearchaeota archaeon]
MRYQLRNYQKRAVDKLRNSYRQGNRRVVLVSPTGSGKTVIASHIIELSYLIKNRHVLFIAHRKEIIDQTSKKLDEIGLPHGIIMSDHPRHDPTKNVQVASIQTLIRRELPPADLIIIDECHRTLSNSYIRTLGKYGNTPVLGLTATPWRTDGRGLGRFYHDMVIVAQVKELVNRGFLVNPDIYAPYNPDLTGVHIRAGDFVEDEVSKIMDKNHLIGNIVNHWKNYANNKCTVVFACSVQHSKNITKRFQEAGVSAEHIDHTTTKEYRDYLLESLATKKLDVLCNVGILTEGWNLPQLECLILARPTASSCLYLQMVGRVMRPTDTKKTAMVLDHAGNVYRHGKPSERRRFDLNDKKKSKRNYVNRYKTCPDCHVVVMKNVRECPMCTYLFLERKLPPEHDGLLHKIETKHIPSCKYCKEQTLRRSKYGYRSDFCIPYYCAHCKKPNLLPAEKAKIAKHSERSHEYYKLKNFAKLKDYNMVWADYRYKDIFGVWPSKDGLKPNPQPSVY